MNPRPLIVAPWPPSPAHEGRPPLTASASGARIAALAGLPSTEALLGLVDATNLCPTYLEALLRDVGRHYAQRLVRRVADEGRTTVVLLGAPVARAVGIRHPAPYQPLWRPRAWRAGSSGGPCWWVATPATDELGIARARRFWRWLVDVAERVADDPRPRPPGALEVAAPAPPPRGVR